jgi:hypothetical protein
MRKTALVRATTLVLFTHLGVTAPAFADAVTYWNEVTLPAVIIGRPGPPGLLDIALVRRLCTTPCSRFKGSSSRIR